MSDAAPSKIPLPEERPGQTVVKAVEHAVRFAAIANAGGAIATLTVYGALANHGAAPNILALPLGLFSLGLVCALLTAANLVFLAVDVTTNDRAVLPRAYRGVAWLLDKSGVVTDIGMVAFFILGCISGVVFVALA